MRVRTAAVPCLLTERYSVWLNKPNRLYDCRPTFSSNRNKNINLTQLQPRYEYPVTSFVEKPQGSVLKAMQEDTRKFDLSAKEAAERPYVASMGRRRLG